MKHFIRIFLIHTFSIFICGIFSTVFFSCVKISDPISASADTSTHSTNFAATDAEGIPGTLTLTVTTQSLNGSYSPRNVIALWVEDSSGKFVRTLGVRAEKRKKYLTEWIKSQGSSEIDGVTGATRSNHTEALVVAWDGKNAGGTKKMNKDIYLLRGELTDHNGKGSTFSISADLSAGSITPSPSSATGFISIAAVYTAP